MAASEFGGVRLRITAYSQNLREYAGSNPMSQTLGTLLEMSISEKDFHPSVLCMLFSEVKWQKTST
ncbi:MAG: hypothetical protein APF81_27880 [Desulfosporosinus sp. BRH_c37]|nr:MAG: hypothetical protein APF81_27880 [Desulfosporosinus sp. BRH_c37]